MSYNTLVILLIAASISCSQSAVIPMNWNCGFANKACQTRGIGQGDRLLMHWTGTHNAVLMFPSKEKYDACDFDGSTEISKATGVILNAPYVKRYFCPRFPVVPPLLSMFFFLSTKFVLLRVIDCPSLLHVSTSTELTSRRINMVYVVAFVLPRGPAPSAVDLSSAEGTTVYYGCSYPGHCKDGQKLALTGKAAGFKEVEQTFSDTTPRTSDGAQIQMKQAVLGVTLVAAFMVAVAL